MDDNQITYFAYTDSRNKKIPFGIKRKDRSRHMYIIGKTGMGKSTVLENMAVQDIKNGEGLAFIDPHGKTADLLLDYVPEERIKDVLYFAPFDLDYPVAFNVMEDVGHDKRHLVANGLMSAFKKIWVDAWSARMEYILNNILLALLEFPDATLIGVNRMLADKDYRKKVVDNITDPSVKSFWVDEFAKYGERYMQEAGAAIQNKIGQFVSNPLVRNIIGQPKSTFDIRKFMDEKKILIINLSKGRVGEANANLLGSMMITKIYLGAMSRADVPEPQLRRLPNFYLYVDEFQSFANESFADILSEARKYKLNLIMAHQYIEQMTDEVRAAVFGNVGSMIVFRVGAIDAEVLEKEFAPTFEVEDLVNLGRFQSYLKLMIDEVTSPPFSALTMPPIPLAEISYKSAIIDASRAAFAQPRVKVEEEIRLWHQPIKNEPKGAGQKEFQKEYVEKESPKNQFEKAFNELRSVQSVKPSMPASVADTVVERVEREPTRPRSTSEERPKISSKPHEVEAKRDAEAELRKVMSLDHLKNRPSQENNKKERSRENVSALRDALSSILKDTPKSVSVKVASPEAERTHTHPENAPKTQTTKESLKAQPIRDVQREVPEDVLKRILDVGEARPK